MSLQYKTESNLYSFYREVAEKANLSSGTLSGVRYIRNKTGSWPAFLLGDAKDTTDVISIAEAMQTEVVPAFWLKRITNDDFNNIARAGGIRLVNKWIGMGLHSETQFVSSGISDVFNFTRVSTFDELNTWTALVNGSRIVNTALEPGVLKAVMDDDRFAFFYMQREGKTVSTILLYLQDNVAGIYFVTTEESERGKGYGSEIVRRAVNYGISKGIYTFVLHSTKMGFSVYRKLGFTENSEYGIYWKMGKY